MIWFQVGGRDVERRTGFDFSTAYEYKEDSVVVSDNVPGKGTLVTRYVVDVRLALVR